MELSGYGSQTDAIAGGKLKVEKYSSCSKGKKTVIVLVLVLAGK